MTAVMIVAFSGFAWFYYINILKVFPTVKSHEDQIRSTFTVTIDTFKNFSTHMPDWYNEKLNMDNFSAGVDKAFDQFVEKAKSLREILAKTVIAIFIMVFILLEAKTFSKRLTQAFGEKKGAEIQSVFGKINEGILIYIRMKTIVSLLVAALCSATMFLMGVEMWPFWGANMFFGNFIPYVGSIVAVIPPIILYFFQTGSIWMALTLTGILIVIQNVVGSYIEPKLAGKALNLSPVLVIIFLLFWGWLWGIVGMILAIPIFVAIKTTLEALPGTRHIAILMGAPKEEAAK